MATRAQQAVAEQLVFVLEWLKYLGLSPEVVADEMGYTRQTPYKWQEFPTRMSPPKLKQLAAACGKLTGRHIHWTSFLRPPGRQRLDEIAASYDEDRFEKALRAVRKAGGR